MTKGENMKRRFSFRFILYLALLPGFLFSFCPNASAIVYNLQAGIKTITMPDGASITMWGFGPVGGEITIPGPVLRVPSNDSTLTINLTNNLPEAVSIIIPGQVATLSPVRFTDSKGRQRVRSFTHETPPGGTASYTWNNIKEGTYIYQSGTHMAVQVQMGLYGSVVKDYAQNEAYPGINYDKEVLLVFSEIDPELHAAVANGTFGTPLYPSTIDYLPKYFLINGVPYPDATIPADNILGTNDTILLRLINAGLKTHVPTIPERYFEVISEDGNPYPYGRTKYTVMLPAGKTKDAVVTLPSAKRYPLFDRRFYLTTNEVSPGGMLMYIDTVEPCIGDLNNDKDVDAFDLVIFISEYGRTDCSQANPCVADLNSDGRVDFVDLLILAANFGRTNCP